MATCPTVRIVADNEQGFTVINECDFNDKEQKLFSDKPVKKEKPKAKPKATKKAD